MDENKQFYDSKRSDHGKKGVEFKQAQPLENFIEVKKNKMEVEDEAAELQKVHKKVNTSSAQVYVKASDMKANKKALRKIDF